MNTIFVVISSGGEYDDAWENNEVACLTKPNALSYIEQAKLKFEKRVKDFADFETVEIERIDNLPALKYAPKIPRPKWKAGIGEKDITPEMRAERDIIDALNEKSHAEYMVGVNEQYAISEKFRNEFFTERGYSEDDSIMVLDVTDDVKYNYQELKVV